MPDTLCLGDAFLVDLRTELPLSIALPAPGFCFIDDLGDLLNEAGDLLTDLVLPGLSRYEERLEDGIGADNFVKSNDSFLLRHNTCPERVLANLLETYVLSCSSSWALRILLTITINNPTIRKATPTPSNRDQSAFTTFAGTMDENMSRNPNRMNTTPM